MCTAITHAFVALAAGKACFNRPMPAKFWLLAAGCSAGPDLDVGLMHWGVPYESFFGHRGFFHSITFALILAIIVVSWAFRREASWFGRRWWRLLAFFFLLTASHGFLDMFTDGGLGIAFFAPFDNTRYWMPWRPIHVSAFGIGSLFTRRGAQVMLSELYWVWLPACGVMLPIVIRRMVMRRRGAAG